jgi:hypothetical protein
MIPVRFKSDFENWDFKNRFNSQRENQSEPEQEKGTSKIVFGVPENSLSNTMITLDNAVSD